MKRILSLDGAHALLDAHADAPRGAHRGARSLRAWFSRRTSTSIVLGLCAWLALVAAAMAGLWKYKSTPGAAGETPREWPVESRIERQPGVPTLVMFAHPSCPCTRASLVELRELMSRFEGRIGAHVVFVLADDASDDSSWRSAASISGVHVQVDAGEAEHRRFGASTSGHVVLYGADGRLSFSGGITGARGHVGDNIGRDQVESSLQGERVPCSSCPVFGCPLESPEQ